MTREQQIEGMADIITSIDDNGYSYDSNGYEITGYANSNKIAAVLCYKGYRRQSDVAREIFEEIEKAIEENCRAYYYEDLTKGYLKVDIDDILAELKKKYTEEKE